MKITILRLCSFLSLLGGFAGAYAAVGQNLDMYGVNQPDFLLGVAYFVSGLAAFALLGTVADIAQKLLGEDPAPESGWAKSASEIGRKEPNPPGWNDPK